MYSEYVAEVVYSGYRLLTVLYVLHNKVHDTDNLHFPTNSSSF